MDDSKKQALARSAISFILGVIVIPAILLAIEFPPSIVAAVGFVGCVIAWIFGFGPRLRHAAIVLVIAIGAVVVTTIYSWSSDSTAKAAPLSPPVISDVQIRLVPEALKGDDLDAHFVFRNKSSQPVTLSLISYHIPKVFSDGQIGKVQIPIGEERKWPINGKKLLQIKMVQLNFAYAFDKSSSKTNGGATFNIPTDAAPGQEIPPSECCEVPKVDIALNRIRQFDAILRTQSKGQMSLGKIPEKDPDGRPVIFVFGQGERRQVVIDMAEGEISFLVTQNGKQRIYQSKVQPTIDNTHLVSLYWNDQNEEAGLKVDGVLAPISE